MDRERTIERLEQLLAFFEEKDIKQFADNVRDAIVLLKEQEAVSVDVCGQMFTVKYGHCPKCNEGLNSEVYPHWCGFCGQAVKWE